MNTSELTACIRAAKQSGRMALIPFITAGFPTPEKFWECLAALDSNGADVIEIGIPFSDPVADGPVVEEASQRALANGVTLSGLLKDLQKRKGQYRAKLVLMGYYNPFLQYGLEAFAEDARMAGVSGCIVPDLPFEESDLFRTFLEEQEMDLIPLVGLNTSKERMELYAKQARGYVYVVSVLGTTGGSAALSTQLADALQQAKDIFPVPIALGFGLSHPDQLATLPHKPDAVVFGSALLRHIDQGKDAGSFLQLWR